jgi:O-antigen/teichoic acid export membrane protein
MIVVWAACAWRPGWFQRGAGSLPLFTYGINFSGANLINYFVRNADKALLGWFVGPGPVGLYERAQKLVLYPIHQANIRLNSIAVPALSRLTNEPEKYRRFFVKGMRFSTAVQAPIVIMSFVFADDIVRCVLGENWTAATPIFRCLFPAALVTVTAPASAWAFLSWGHTDKLFRATIFGALGRLAALCVAAPFGPVAVALTISIITVIFRAPYLAYCFRPTPLRLRDLWYGMWESLLAATVAGLISLPASYLAAGQAGAFVRLPVGLTLFGTIYLAVLLTLPNGMDLLRDTSMALQRRKLNTAAG